MNIRWPTLIASALALACMTTASADDGEKVLKRMTPNDPQLTVAPEEVGLTVAESEHAFIDMMKFYVPAQMASGALDSADNDNVDVGVYNNIEEIEVEYLPVAKPLVSVFIHGPAIGVGELPFAHSFMDAYAAVSLDDGLTWKTTNLSLSADQTSFTLGEAGGGDGHDEGDHEIPADHNQVEKEDGLIAFHAPGMDYPYTNECTECHGPALQGGHHKEPSCYSCHGPIWKEDAPDGIMVVFIEEATAKTEKNKIKLKVDGAVEGVDGKTTATLINGVTETFLDTTKVEDNGKFHFELEYYGLAPCTIRVTVEGVESSVIPVVDKKTGEAIENCEGEPHDFTEYPGGVHNIFHATAGNKVLVAWPSRYCEQGKPAYSLGNEDETELTRVVNFIQTGQAADGNNTLALPDFNLEDDLYLVDAFGVAGSQKSSDFADEGYPEVGEVPYGCVWTARGVMLPGDDLRTDEVEMSHMVWTKAERLTSGRRDPFRIEVKAVLDKDGPYEGGFVVTWQEDPDGLRPGQGLGPGEGWSGAVAHNKTDIWYSFINMEYFDYVLNEVDGVPINIATHILEDSGRPKAFVPMAIPMRLTNNDKCKVDALSGELVDTSLYCHFEEYDFGEVDDPIVMAAGDYGIKDQCMDTVLIPTGPNDDLKPICVSEDGLPNIANTASTRPRLSVQESDSGSAWVIVAAEESKGLGAFFYYPNGDECTEDREDPLCQEEIGKNQWYFSFDMGTPDTSADKSETSLVKNLVSQGNMLNQPEVYWGSGAFLPLMDTSVMWEFSDYNFQIYNTEIARRSSLLAQSVDKAATGTSGLLAISSWKQGPMRQGGPADTMFRRFVDQGTSLNPYAFTNMVCNNWDFLGGTNPYYPDGVCLDPATNLSSVSPDTCTDTGTGLDIPCPSVDEFGVGDTNPILQGYTQGEGNTQKVLTWHQCPSAGTVAAASDGTAPVTCDANDLRGNLADQSWYNPLDVSKGHRGFLDGDSVMFMYAWSPNWRLNAKGNDRYDLYVRRSFDGGETWTTTPGTGTASDGLTPFAGVGTTTCETYRSLETQASGDVPEPQVCYTYPAGGAEQARNVTQHSRMRITTLDPRYAPTAATIPLECLDFNDPTIFGAPWSCDDTSRLHDSDLRDPSRFFIVYETGDNSTVEEGEAEPMDLFYSRAIDFGDNYVVWADEVVDADLSECYPNDPHDDEKVIDTPANGSGFCNEFDRMNASGDTHSSEANLEANPDGSKLYGVWAQWVLDDLGEEVIEADPMARRLWWIDNYIAPDELTWTLPGTNKE